MVDNSETVRSQHQPDYGYGNHNPIEVIRIVPHIGSAALDPHASLDTIAESRVLFTEAELEEKVTEVADNYRVIGDPQSSEANPKVFGVTIVNKHLLDEGIPGILMMSTTGSSLYDEKGNPNNEGNALELAYMAIKHPDRPIVFVESPGDGNSVDLENEEYREAAKDGKLIHETRGISGRIVKYEPFQTLQSLARALEYSEIRVSHISSNGTGAHFSTALMTGMQQGAIERAFLYNPSNISDRSTIALTIANLMEITGQGKYAKLSKDPLRLTDERKKMARRVMGSITKRKIDQARASTHNPIKLWRQQKIFRRGNGVGQSAAVQSVAAQMQHPNIKQTFVFPEFAAQYKSPEDFYEFMRIIGTLGGAAVEMTDIESLQIPLGQYGHSHYPTVRQTLEGYAFNR